LVEVADALVVEGAAEEEVSFPGAYLNSAEEVLTTTQTGPEEVVLLAAAAVVEEATTSDEAELAEGSAAGSEAKSFLGFKAAGVTILFRGEKPSVGLLHATCVRERLAG
jgi:hypothetical protein